MKFLKKDNFEKDIISLEPFEALERFCTIMNKHRFLVFKEICENPGISFKELQEKLKINKSTLSKILNLLSRADIIVCEYKINKETKKINLFVYPKKEALFIIKKELDLLYIQAKKKR